MTAQRQSNIELLRNIAMFLILVIHANFVSLPRIQYDEMITNLGTSIVRFFIESLGIVAVNVFVFISGWFGIRTTKKSVLSFMYLIIFFLGGGYVLSLILGVSTFSIERILDIFQFRGDWFIKSYFVLMILSPILNSYTKNTDERMQRHVLIAFLLFESIYGWVAGGRRFFVNGYGPLHFIGLYITAQYIHNMRGSTTTPFIKKIFQMPKWIDLSIFFLSALINTIAVYLGSFYLGEVRPVFSAIYAYSNPLNIIGGLYLLLFFSKIEMPYVKVINWLGASSFAVYLFHSECWVRNRFFNPQIQYLYGHFTGLGCIGMIFLFLCFIYLISILIDQMRIFSWNKIWSCLNKSKE